MIESPELTLAASPSVPRWSVWPPAPVTSHVYWCPPYCLWNFQTCRCSLLEKCLGDLVDAMAVTAKMAEQFVTSRFACLCGIVESDLLINLCAFSRGTTGQTVCNG